MKTAVDLMTREVTSVHEDDSVRDVGQRFLESGHHGLPVLDASGRVTGMVTERDLIDAHRQVHLPTVIALLDSIIPVSGLHEYQEELRKATAVTAGQLASHDLVLASPEDSLDAVADKMFQHGFHVLPVADGAGRLVGIISRSDILRELVRTT